MNKKLLSVLICVLLVFVSICIVSCGNDGVDTSGTTNTDTSTSTNTDTGNQETPPEPELPTECTVTFSLGNGEADIVETVKYNEVLRKIPTDPQRTGYQFKGWLCNGKTWIPAKVTENITVVASWSPNNNTLAFLPNGADNTMDPMVIASDATVKLNACTLTKKGADFLGWATEEDGEVVYLDGADFTMGTEKFNHLYAVWSNATYEITYELNGGTNAEGNPTEYTMDSPVSFSDASKEGYTFEGWTYNGEILESTEGLAEDITLVAKFELIRFNINYVMLEGAANGSNPTDFNREDEITLADPFLAGYDFIGWFADEALTVPFTKIALGTEQDVTVYASFKILPFTITYIVPDALTNNKDNIAEFTVNTEFTFLDPTVNAKGYSFTGWYLADTNVKVEALTPNSYFTSITLEARYELTNYKITYATEGIAMPSDAPTTYTVLDSSDSYVLPTDLTKFGYAFGGWYTSHPDNYTYENPVEKIEIDPENPTDITVYAKFTLQTYTITYVLGDLAGTTHTNPTTFDVVNPVTFTEPTTATLGYTFINWYLNPEKTMKVTTTEGIGENITVYARWVEGDNKPTTLVKADDISEIFASPGNPAIDNGLTLFDGKKESVGIYGGGNVEWYGMAGDSLTIIFKEELDVLCVTAFGVGNWSLSTHTFYDKDGNVTYVKEGFVFNGTDVNTGWDEDGDGDNFVFEPSEELPSIKVKKIVILLTENKWNSATTNKFCEYEIEIENPNYVDPDAQ